MLVFIQLATRVQAPLLCRQLGPCGIFVIEVKVGVQTFVNLSIFNGKIMPNLM